MINSLEFRVFSHSFSVEHFGIQLKYNFNHRQRAIRRVSVNKNIPSEDEISAVDKNPDY